MIRVHYSMVVKWEKMGVKEDISKKGRVEGVGKSSELQCYL